MDKRKGAVLLMIPIFMMMAVPIATHAATVEYVIVVECDSYNSSHTADTASLIFLGHGVTVFCKYHSGYSEDVKFFSSSQSGVYKALMDAGSDIQTDQGTFGPSPCGTYVNGAVFDRQGYTYAFFEISIACG